MQEKINNWLNINYNEIVSITNKITKNKEYRDIAHYIILQFMDNKMATTLIDNNQALKYITGMVYRTYHSNTSPWARQNIKMYSIYDNIEIEQDEYDPEIDELIQKIESILNDKHTDIVLWFNITLLKMYIINPNYVSLSKQLDIPRTTISHSINSAKKWIKNKLKNDNYNFN